MNIKDKIKMQETRLNEIYTRYRQFMLSITRIYIDDAHLCEDMVHNAFTSVILNKEKICEFPEPVVKAYIVLATRHACIDYLRKERRQNLVDLPDDILVELLSRSQERSSDSQAPFKTVEFYSVIKKLSIEDQTLLIGHHVIGLNTRELAKLVGCKPDALRVKLYRARKRTLELFKELGLRMEDFF